MIETITVVLGREPTNVLTTRRTLRQADLCFPLQMTRREIRNAVRNKEIPTIRSGKNLVADTEQLCAWMEKRDELLGIEFIRGFCEGRFDLPRTVSPDEKPESLIRRLDLLDASQRHESGETPFERSAPKGPFHVQTGRENGSHPMLSYIDNTGRDPERPRVQPQKPTCEAISAKSGSSVRVEL